MPGRLWPALATVCALLLPAPSPAHERSQSFSQWRMDGTELAGEFTIDARRATLLLAENPAGAGGLAGVLGRHLAATIELEQSGSACRLAPVEAQAAAAGWLRAGLRFVCPLPLHSTPAELRIGALFRYAATHLHLAGWRDSDGAYHERVLSPQADRLRIGPPGSAHEGFLSLLRLGAWHVISGPDHVAFLAALLFLVSGWRARLLTVTGFTLGHSLTLGLAALGRIGPHGPTVEALIAYSVLLTALQAARQRDLLLPRLRPGLLLLLGLLGLGAWLGGRDQLSLWTWLAVGLMWLWLWRPRAATGGEAALAAGFGLLHGAGFAGALNVSGMPTDALLINLLAFNLGVEVGQLLLLAAMLLLGQAARPIRFLSPRPASALCLGLLGGAGAYWFALRAVGVS